MNVQKWLSDLGYPDANVPTLMSNRISAWWAWYTSTADFYSETYTNGKRKYSTSKISMSVARMVSEAWASLILNEAGDVKISFENNDVANEWLEDWINSSGFLFYAPQVIQRMCALGTAAWALRLENVAEYGKSAELVIKPQRFDASQIIPLTYDEDSCTEAAFKSSTVIDGKPYDMVQAYLKSEDGTYTIKTAYIDKDEQKLVHFDGYAEEVNTGSYTQPFTLLRLGLDNPYWQFSPFGVSIFDGAIGTLALAENALNSLNSDLRLGKKRMFFSDNMIPVDDNGKVQTTQMIEQELYRSLGNPSLDDKGTITEYNPDLRVDDNRKAIDTALLLLGMRTGLGAKFFSLDSAQGIKTATEVASDNSELMRNLVKHENAIEPAMVIICRAACEIQSALGAGNLGDTNDSITVTFDDSIIQDTDALRERDRADVAAGLMQAWEYRSKWYGETEEQAREMTEVTTLPETEY